MRTALVQRTPAAGIVAGIIAVLFNQGVGYALVPWICASQINPVPVLAIATAAVALLGSFLSWRTLPGRTSAAESHAGGRPLEFLAGVAVLFGFLCAALVLTQGAAGLVFNGCER